VRGPLIESPTLSAFGFGDISSNVFQFAAQVPDAT
jgi:hypothetical protein